MKQAPLITVGITCYNAAGTIRRAVHSAIRQNWPRLDIVVVDDGSTDASAEIIENEAGKDDRIRFVRHAENKGFPAALNTIIKQAKGEAVAFFDDDDESRPDRVRLQWERLENYRLCHGTDLVFCYANRRVAVSGSRANERSVLAIGREPPEPWGECVADFILCHLQTPPFVWGQFGSCTLMTRKSTLETLGSFDEAFRRCAEWDMAIRLGRAGGHFIAVNAPLVTQYVTGGEDKIGRKPLKYALDLRKKYKTYLSGRGLYGAAVAMAAARFYYAKNMSWRFRFFTILACLLAPRAMVPQVFSAKFKKT